MGVTLTRKGIAAGAAAVLLLAIASLAWRATTADAATLKAQATIANAAGDELGVVRFLRREDGRIMVRASLEGLSAGFHGFHVHAAGDCTVGDAANPFTAAGGHYGHDATGGVFHGSHPGDMPVLLATDDGTAVLRFVTDGFKARDVIGKAVIVHASPDNYANVPTGTAATQYTPNSDDPADTTTATGSTRATGNAGPRVGCGVIDEA